MLEDISKSKWFTEEWDRIILDAFDYGHISCARVQSLLDSKSYTTARLIIDTAIECGYFDFFQRPIIEKCKYQEIIANRSLIY